MSLRRYGIDPEFGYAVLGVAEFADRGSLGNRFPQGQGYADLGGTVGVGPVTLSTATPDSGAVRDAAGTAAAFVQGQTAFGSGPDYRPAPALPAVGVLDYVQKFSTATLATVGLLVLLVVLVKNPRGAFHWIARSGVKRAGLE
jgi:hypothetical protein